MRRRAWPGALALTLGLAAPPIPAFAQSQPESRPPPTPAPAQETDKERREAPERDKDKDKDKEKKPAVELHGYVQPQFGFRYRSAALPRDEWEVGGLSSRAGLMVSGTPAERWSYMVHLSLDARSLLVLAGVDIVDRNGDGAVDAVEPSRAQITATLFEEVTVSAKPFDWLTIKAGAMRMPFTVALRSANTAQLFPNRPGANEVFQSGSDQGILVVGHWLEERLQGSVGVFTGSSLGLLSANGTTRGLLYSARFDANPFGELPSSGVDFDRGGPRLGIGTGALFRDGTVYTKTGYELADTRDIRLSGSLRFALYGLYLQGEALRRLATDNVTSRPNQATGGYVQGSFFLPLGKELGLAPIGRVGLSTEDEVTLPRRTLYIEGGVAFFPRRDLPRPDTLRLVVQYLGERRTPERETAHSVVSQLQVLF